MSISIDGERETHDLLRGVVGTHARAIAALAHESAAGMQVAANTQLNRFNRHELHAVLDRPSLPTRNWVGGNVRDHVSATSSR